VPQGLIDGPLPSHYEPVESPFRNPVYGQQSNPTRKEYLRSDNRINPSPPENHSEVFPYIFTTSRLTEHHTAGGMSRYLQYLAELQPEMFVEVSPDLAEERGLEHMGWCHVITARAAVEGRVLVTERLSPLRIEGRTVHQVWLPYHWGAGGFVTGDSANDLFGISLDPNVLIQESKVGTCDVRAGRRPTGTALLDYIAGYQGRSGVDDDHEVSVVTVSAATVARSHESWSDGDEPSPDSGPGSTDGRHPGGNGNPPDDVAGNRGEQT
jgi:formate dehydrogenase major subunit